MTKTNISIIVTSFLLLSILVFSKNIYAQGKIDTGSVPDGYIVVFNDNVSVPDEHANEMAKKFGLSLVHTFTHALKGFSAIIPQARLEQIKKDPTVKFVSEDKVVSIEAKSQGKPTPTPIPQPLQRIPSGISRIGQNSTNYGTGVGVAVIDTGIDLNHPDLAANIAGDYSCVKNKLTGDDDNGHGTHVAGTIAAINNSIGVVGVAPEAKLYAIKVLNFQGSGTWSSVICGIDWVTAHASSIKVANMSLGGSGSSDNNCGKTNSDALHQAICRSRDAGITYVVAAGNEGDNTADHVPSAYNDAVITVSALVDTDGKVGSLGSSSSYGMDDTFASFSNFGSVVDLGAPGINIYSTWKGNGYNTISGTSMATPHISGAAALYLHTYPGVSWTQVRDGLISTGESLGSGHTDPSNLHQEKIVITKLL